MERVGQGHRRSLTGRASRRQCCPAHGAALEAPPVASYRDAASGPRPTPAAHLQQLDEPRDRAHERGPRLLRPDRRQRRLGDLKRVLERLVHDLHVVLHLARAAAQHELRVDHAQQEGHDGLEVLARRRREHLGRHAARVVHVRQVLGEALDVLRHPLLRRQRPRVDKRCAEHAAGPAAEQARPPAWDARVSRGGRGAAINPWLILLRAPQQPRPRKRAAASSGPTPPQSRYRRTARRARMTAQESMTCATASALSWTC